MLISDVQIKIILGHLLTNYDICFEDPVRGKPDLQEVGNQLIPDDAHTRILIRRRATQEVPGA